MLITIKKRTICLLVGVALLVGIALQIAMLLRQNMLVLAERGCFSDGGRVELPPAWQDQSGTVKLLALGDVGTSDEHQYSLVRTIKKICAKQGCDGALLLGDNIYPAGVKDVDDPKWRTAFEDAYSSLEIPFFAVLGNHDVQGSSLAQVKYTQHSRWWFMPSTRYNFSLGAAQFYAQNSNCQLLSWKYLPKVWHPKRSPQHPWVIVMAHHSIYSTGPHADTNSYNIRQWKKHWAPYVDILITGHNHLLESLDYPQDEVLHLVSGAAGKLAKDISRRGVSPPRTSKAQSTFRYDSGAGFLWLEITAKKIRVVFYDKDGQVLHTIERTAQANLSR